ncbi:MAG TPA: single-stranded DNA-binding protein [Trebonia sp.]|nr:single-stranded DNA-binding protein [Trebonia sp.]
MSVAAVTLTGYVALEPKLWFTKQAQVPVVNLRVGTTPRRMDASSGEWKDGPTSFFTINCWRKLALNVSASLHRGDPVIIRGQLRMRSWTDNGKARSTVEIEAESVGHDIAYGFSHFMRGIHPSVLSAPEGSALATALANLGALPTVGEPLDNAAAEQGSAELASGSGPLGEGRSDDSAGIPDGEVASEGVPF